MIQMHQRETVQRSTSESPWRTSSKSWKSATSFSAGTRSSNDELVAEEEEEDEEEEEEEEEEDEGNEDERRQQRQQQSRTARALEPPINFSQTMRDRGYEDSLGTAQLPDLALAGHSSAVQLMKGVSSSKRRNGKPSSFRKGLPFDFSSRTRLNRPLNRLNGQMTPLVITGTADPDENGAAPSPVGDAASIRGNSFIARAVSANGSSVAFAEAENEDPTDPPELIRHWSRNTDWLTRDLGENSDAGAIAVEVDKQSSRDTKGLPIEPLDCGDKVDSHSSELPVALNKAVGRAVKTTREQSRGSSPSREKESGHDLDHIPPHLLPGGGVTFGADASSPTSRTKRLRDMFRGRPSSLARSSIHSAKSDLTADEEEMEVKASTFLNLRVYANAGAVLVLFMTDIILFIILEILWTDSVCSEISIDWSASDFGEGNVTSAQDRNSQELEGGELVEVSQILGHKIHWEIVTLLIVMAILYL